jgi:hypothetical protein
MVITPPDRKYTGPRANGSTTDGEPPSCWRATKLVALTVKEPKPPDIAYLVPRFLYLYVVGLNKKEPKPPDFSHRARKVLCWPRRCTLAHAFLWDYSYGRIKG